MASRKLTKAQRKKRNISIVKKVVGIAAAIVAVFTVLSVIVGGGDPATAKNPTAQKNTLPKELRTAIQQIRDRGIMGPKKVKAALRTQGLIGSRGTYSGSLVA